MNARDRSCTTPHLPRADAIGAANGTWLNEVALDGYSPEQLAKHLEGFYLAVDPNAWHRSVVRRSTGLIRHGLNHLLRGSDPLEVRFARCLPPDGPYAVAGLGSTFWAAVVKAINPGVLPDWSHTVAAGLERTGQGEDFGAACEAYTRLLAKHPDLTATDLDRFFRRAGVVQGRQLPESDPPPSDPASLVPDLVRRVRVRTPLRKRLANQGRTIADTRTAIASAAAAGDRDAALTLLVGFAAGVGISDGSIPFGLWQWVETVFRAEPDSLPATVPHDVSPGFASAALHLCDPARFPLWTEPVARGLTRLDDADHPSLAVPDRYVLLRDVAAGLRDRFRVHPLEVADVLTIAGQIRPSDDFSLAPDPSPLAPVFTGFCTDTFRFLGELAAHNDSAWMADQRERYQFAVREPLVELCEAVAGRYVGPVLNGEYGWDLETDPRTGRALTSIVKNDFGRSAPYQPVLWVTYYRRSVGTKRNDVQLFARLDPTGVSIGFHLGRHARDAGRRFRKNVQDHADLLYRSLRATGAVDDCAFATGPDGEKSGPMRSGVDLRAWAVEKDLFASRHIPADAAVLRSDDLANEVLLTFDRLVPLFAAAVEDDPIRVLARRAGDPSAPVFDRAAFRSETGLSDLWLTRTLDLLRLKKQLILQGVPGTGKTHVARSLARLLAGNRSDAVRLVQFHPGYSYEEFVEGIRPQTVQSNGRSEVAYPVTDGVLTAFAAKAAARPADPHVLLIDEVNRGNLPRVFGELLFLLEYRDQAVTLPYSKREFRLPPNLYLVGTMNPTDRSTGSLDQALRRRFSFVDMPPDPAVLATWLESHPPETGDDGFGVRVVRLFEELNRRLARDLGPDKQIGHSVFMVAGLTEEKLRAVWDHHVRPVLAEYFAGQPGRMSGYEPERMTGESTGRKAKSV